jgi:hypothetical protein
MKLLQKNGNFLSFLMSFTGTDVDILEFTIKHYLFLGLFNDTSTVA